MSKENVIAYRDILVNSIKDKKAFIKKELESYAADIEYYNANNVMALSKSLSVYSVELARIEGQLEVLRQIVGEQK